MRFRLPWIFDDEADHRPCAGLFEHRRRVLHQQRQDRLLNRIGVVVLAAVAGLCALAFAGCGCGGSSATAPTDPTQSLSVQSTDGFEDIRDPAEIDALARVRELLDANGGRLPGPPAPPTAGN